MAGGIYDQVGSLELRQMDRGERVEKKVDIYESIDALRVQETEDTDTVHTLPAVRRRGRRCSRLTAVCLGLLCVLLLITILIYMYSERASFISYITNLPEEKDQLNISLHDLANERDQLNISLHDLANERDQLNTSLQNLANERDQLNISLQNLANERDQLNISLQNLANERDQLNISLQNLANERDQLNISLQNLANEKDQLNINLQNLANKRDQLNINLQNLANERDQLNINLQNLTEEKLTLQRKYDHLLQQIEKNICFHEWKEFGSSFYFFSTEQKTWSESRQHCRVTGADLVIINSRDEQVFLIDQNKSTRFWIGLTKIKSKGQNQWMWVDNQLLSDE
ncbi:C-type lectin domain family 4 member F-like [Astyanax mexicanus]|uniref:C-type lectin domain family 4 member F-like n=1 Tax=Astyanax mexicanus TaxID=7994 RepID=UPI0020CABB34|nr:C-type lectin domain family 4 member F-like [Astyanax mexicanus]